MPTYEYRCAKCGEDLEVFQTFAESPLTKHKGCGGKLAKVLSPAGIVLKGSGFYKTDNRNSTKRSGSKDTNGRESSGSESKGSDAAGAGGSSSTAGEAKGSESTGSGSGAKQSDGGSGSSASDAKKPAAKSA